MKFACKCLNFLIEGSYNAEPVDESVKKELSRVNQVQDWVYVKCDSVIKRVDILVGTVNNILFSTGDGEQWTGYYCRNCGVWMYCSRSDDVRATPAIVNNATRVEQADIEKLKKDSNFSEIFKILIFNVVDMTSFAGMRDQAALETLHPVASSWLERETAMSEILIKEFADQQFAEMESKRLRAYSEHVALKRVVASDKRRRVSPLKPKRMHGADTKVSKGAGDASPTKMMEELDLDDYFMFESKTPEGSFTSEVSGDEEQEAPTARRLSEPMLARSLPIPVPRFMEDRLHDDRHERSPQTPADIAANIRALARSVHGNPVFGDLPRPRLSKE